MADLVADNVENVISACRENLDAITHSLNSCLHSSYRLELGDTLDWEPDLLGPEFGGAGIAVTFKVGEAYAACLIPQTLPLPSWYVPPDETETSRLQTLSMEWSMAMVPAEMEVEQFETLTLDDLGACVNNAKPLGWATALELHVFAPEADATEADATDDADVSDETPAGTDDNSDDAAEEPTDEESASEEPTDEESTSEEESAEQPISEDAADEGVASEEASEETAASGESPAVPVAKFYLIWALERAPGSSDEEHPEEATEPSAPAAASASAAPAVPMSPEQSRALRLMGLPVEIIVQLATKKIEISQLRQLTPGALVTFDKSCEDLLDLYVNNQLLCRGEAVKIGEKFGLKINEVGAVEVREERVLSG